MINDSSIRLYIFKNYIKYVNIDIKRLSFVIYSKLKTKFLLYEEIIYNNKEGMIYKISSNQLSVVSLNKKFKCKNEDLIRKYKIDQTIIFEFLNLITYQTPFGFRLLKKGIFRHMATKDNLIPYFQMLNNISDDNKKKKALQKKEQIIDRKIEIFNIDTKYPILKNTQNDSVYEKKNLKKLDDHHFEYRTFKDILNTITIDEIFKIPELDFETTIKLIRIYSFIVNFCNNKIYGNLNISKLLRHFKEQQYLSEILGNVHGFLIENLLEEKQNIGFECFLTNIKSVMDAISEEFPSDDFVNGNEIGMKNWKLKVRNLLFDMWKASQNKTIVTFFNVLNKKSPYELDETIVMRIYLLEFLINCYMSTNIFRDIILKEINNVKKLENLLKTYMEKTIKIEEENNSFINYNRQIIDQKDNELDIEKSEFSVCVTGFNNTVDMDKKDLVSEKGRNSDIENNFPSFNNKSKIRNLIFKIVKSPAKIEIGNINSSKFILVNNQVFFTKNETIYIPSKNTLIKIIENYEPIDKAEALTVYNLSNIVKSLY